MIWWNGCIFFCDLGIKRSCGDGDLAQKDLVILAIKIWWFTFMLDLDSNLGPKLGRISSKIWFTPLIWKSLRPKQREIWSLVTKFCMVKLDKDLLFHYFHKSISKPEIFSMISSRITWQITRSDEAHKHICKLKASLKKTIMKQIGGKMLLKWWFKRGGVFVPPY